MTDVQTPAMRLAGPVEVRVPADPAMSRVLRLPASGLASLFGFDVEQIEDLKIAVSEVLIALVEHGYGDFVDISFFVESGVFVVSGVTEVDQFDVDHPDLRLCRTVLAGVCADHDIKLVGDTARITATIRQNGR